MRNKLLVCLCLLIGCALYGESCFIAIDENGTVVCAYGAGHDVRMSPCSTFKIALSLMGFDAGVLIDEQNPEWPYEHQDNCVELVSWESAQNPKTWIQNSVVWYSRDLVRHLGIDRMKRYLSLFSYSNQDVSGDISGKGCMWLNSSLKISLREQVDFLQKVLCGKFPVSSHAVHMTKKLFYEHAMEDGWCLYGKTGSEYAKDIDGNLSGNYSAWYVGWLEKEAQLLIFALQIQGEGAPPGKVDRIAMVKKYLKKNMLLELPC